MFGTIGGGVDLALKFEIFADQKKHLDSSSVQLQALGAALLMIHEERTGLTFT